ncbi:MAG: MFS transporter, partial [Candidatus Bathyarchaeota archaeon]|nr:MFS transporter [Candidatus Bathyarchaeota archaeon]
AIFSIIGGHIADLYGRKRIVSLMTITLGLSQFLVAFAPNWQFLATAIIITNICWIFEPAFWAILADSINEEKRGTAFALFSCLSFLPWVIMPSVGGYFIDIYGVLVSLRIAYIFLAIVGLINGLIRLFMLNETVSPRDKKAWKLTSFGEMISLVKDAFRGQIQTWKWMPKAALALAASYILWAFEYGLVEPYWIVYAQEIIGITSAQWGIIVGFGSIISISSKILLVGKLLDKSSRRKILLATTALDVFTYLIFISCGIYIQVLALWAAASLLWSFYEPTYSSLEADLIPEERRGRVFAAFGAAWSAFSIPATLLGGFIYEKVNPQLSFIIASIVILLCFLLTAFFIKPSNYNEKQRGKLKKL